MDDMVLAAYRDIANDPDPFARPIKLQRASLADLITEIDRLRAARAELCEHLELVLNTPDDLRSHNEAIDVLEKHKEITS